MDLRIGGAPVAAEIQLAGGMVSPEFEVAGATVRPLYTAPWEPFASDPLLSRLRGDFACVPFGIAPETTDGFPERWRTDPGPVSPYPHGYPANVVWNVSRVEPGEAELVVDLPDTEAVAQVRRMVSCRAGGVELVDELLVRRDAELPLGLHPMVRLPEVEHGAVVLPPQCRVLQTYPIATDASSVLLRHCLLWISNRGRSAAPWNSRNLCLGVEPISSAFDLGAAISAGPNPLAAQGMPTAVPLRAGGTYRLWHRLAVEPMPDHTGACSASQPVLA